MHWLINPIKNHYFDFKGRATRQEFWMFFLANLAVLFFIGAFYVLGLFIGNLFISVVLLPIGLGLFFLLFLAATVIPTMAISVRRLHDIGKSGWWYVFGFVPYIGGVVLLIFYCLKSEPGANKWGVNKYGATAVSNSLQSEDFKSSTIATASGTTEV